MRSILRIRRRSIAHSTKSNAHLAHRFGLINNYLFQVLTLAGINIIMTLSLNLVIGITGQFSLGHAGFMSIGAYFGAIVSRLMFQVMSSNEVNNCIVLLVAMVVGGAVSAFFGFLISMPTLKVKGDYLAIVTLGFGEIIRAVWRIIPYVGGALGFTGIPKLTTFTIVFLVIIFTIYTTRNFIGSSIGRSCLAIRENEIAAEAAGIDCRKYKVMAFVYAAFLAGVALDEADFGDGLLIAATERRTKDEIDRYAQALEKVIR